MPPKKKKKLTKSQKRKLLHDKGRKGNEARGWGVGGRRNFELPALWHSEISDENRERFVSPGKTVYTTQKSVEATFATRDLKNCLTFNEATSSESDDTAKDPDFSTNSDEEPSMPINGYQISDFLGNEVEKFISGSGKIKDFQPTFTPCSIIKHRQQMLFL